MSNVFGSGRGAWTLFLDGAEIASGDDERVSAKDGITASKEQDALELSMPRRETGSYTLSWS